MFFPLPFYLSLPRYRVQGLGLPIAAALLCSQSIRNLGLMLECVCVCVHMCPYVRVCVCSQVDLRHPQCQREGCTRQAICGQPGTRALMFCARQLPYPFTSSSWPLPPHIALKAALVMSMHTYTLELTWRWRHCHEAPRRIFYPQHENPTKRFRRVDVFIAWLYDRHRRKGQVNLVSSACREAGCILRPVFGPPHQEGVPESGKARYCSAHKMPGDVNLMQKQCAASGCSRAASYALAREC